MTVTLPQIEEDGTTEILITGEGTNHQFPVGGEASQANIFSRPVGEDGKLIRGLSPDLIVLVTDVSDEIREEVLQPMHPEMIVEMY